MPGGKYRFSPRKRRRESKGIYPPISSICSWNTRVPTLLCAKEEVRREQIREVSVGLKDCKTDTPVSTGATPRHQLLGVRCASPAQYS